MNIRYGLDGDKKKAENIWRENFTDSENEIQFYFNELYRDENFLILEDEGEIKASLYENPYTLSLNGELFPSFYIVAVAVSPEYRGRGYMNQLLSYSLKKASESKDIIFLSPINPEIYKKMGFGYMSSLETYTLPLRELPNNKINREIEIKKVDERDFDNLVYIYERKIGKSFGYLKRDREYYTRIKKEIENEGGSIYIFYKEKQPIAYISIYFKEDEIFIRELITLSSEIISTILAFIKSFKEYYSQLVIKSPRGSNIDFLISNQLAISKKETPFIMGRVLDVKNILTLLQIKGYQLKIKITDLLIEKNNGVFLIEKDGSIKKVESQKWNLTLDISDFCSLAMGYFSGEELFELGKMCIKDFDIEMLDKIFPKRKFYIQEYQ